MNDATVYDCGLIWIRKVAQRTGKISIVESGLDLPFEVQRVFYLYDIPSGEDRGAHAHRACHQFLVAASGAFDVVVDDGRTKRTFRLDRPDLGLHVPPGVWAAEQAFSSGAICLVLASDKFDPKDYIRDYGEFLALREKFRNTAVAPESAR